MDRKDCSIERTREKAFWLDVCSERRKEEEPTMHEILEEIQANRPDLIPVECDVNDEYGIFRSFQIGATTEARNRGLSKELIELNNGWRMVEASRGKHTTSDMLAYYMELSLSMVPLVRFSGIL